jgi:hypothetical protein
MNEAEIPTPFEDSWRATLPLRSSFPRGRESSAFAPISWSYPCVFVRFVVNSLSLKNRPRISSNQNAIFSRLLFRVFSVLRGEICLALDERLDRLPKRFRV